MKLVRVLNYTSRCNFSESLQLLKYYAKKKPKSKVSLAPRFVENVKRWPKLLEEEKKATFEKLNEMIAAGTNWRTIEERGLCAGNMILKDKFTDVVHGTIAVFSIESRGSRIKWMRVSAPVLVNILDADGRLETICEGHVLEFSEGLIKVCAYDATRLDYANQNYILMPSTNSGAIAHLQKVLNEPDTLSSDSVHLINLAYRAVQMPSIHDSKIRNLPETLNASQVAAVSAALNPHRNLLCIQGPPGTGKTHVIAEIVTHLTARKKKVLVCAPTHVAVQNAYDATARRMQRDIVPEHVEKQLLVLSSLKKEIENHKDISKLKALNEQLARMVPGTPLYQQIAFEFYKCRVYIMNDLVGPRRAIFSTLQTSSIQKLPEFGWDADVMLVDEAAQCTEPTTWVPVLTTPKCRKLVLVGDPKQLPAIVISDEGHKNNLKRSLMEKLSEDFADCNINILLNEQYRMNRKIMRWSNEVFYEDKLSAHLDVADITLHDICPKIPEDHVLNNPVIFIDMDGKRERSGECSENKSFYNRDESEVVTEYVNRLVIDTELDEREIAVISPYYAQIEQLRASIRFRVDVNTVDAFQGQERQVIVFCLVRDNQDGLLGFLQETRRFNVAITRAKRQFVLIGSGKMLRRNKHLKRLHEHLAAGNMIFNSADILRAFDDFDDVRLPARLPATNKF